MPFEKIFDSGIVQIENSFIKIIKIFPINYDLKSNLEKEAILNSYKLFLKTCDFDIQIIIQSKKENLSTHIYNIENFISNEKNPKIKEISKKYIEYIQIKNQENKASSKNFYIIIKEENYEKMNNTYKNIEKYLTKTLPLEKTFSEVKKIQNIHNLIKSKGGEFSLT